MRLEFKSIYLAIFLLLTLCACADIIPQEESQNLKGDAIRVNVTLDQDIESSDKSILEKFMDDPVPFLALAATLSIGLAQIYIRRKTLRDNQLLKATEYFTGRSQNRNVGIAMIEGLVANRSYAKVLIPLLYNQFVYLLIAANPSDKQPQGESKIIVARSRLHEEKNLSRIADLLHSLIVFKLKWYQGLFRFNLMYPIKKWQWDVSMFLYREDEQHWISWILLNIEKRLESEAFTMPEHYGIMRSYLNVDKSELIRWKQQFEAPNQLDWRKAKNRQLDSRIVEEGSSYKYHVFSARNQEVIIISKTYLSYKSCDKALNELKQIISLQASINVMEDKRDSRLYRFDIKDENNKVVGRSVRYTSREQLEKRKLILVKGNFK